MAQNPIRTAATAEGGLVVDTLLEAIVKRFGYVLNTGESLGDLDFDVGEPPLVVISADNGFLFFYDATDATTVADGSTCLVSGNGLRYKASSGARPFMSSALTFATAPPGSPTVGDVHIVGVGTGDFAGHDDEIAFYTRRGWRFAAPEVGLTLLVDSTGTNWQFSDTGWGAFPVELADGSVPPTALQFPAGIVVEDTLNAPPGSPTTGKFWIVGSVPSGAFIGHGADLAYWTGSAWAFMDPADGWAAYHKTSGFQVFYVSGAWLGGNGSDLQEFNTAGGATWTKPSKGNLAIIECWGAGGSGARATNGEGAGAGAGGSYTTRVMPLTSLTSTVAVTVGAGGPARTTNTGGAAGGNSSFGAYLIAYGGGGGSESGASGGGGGGGGQGGAGADGSADGGNGGVTGSGQAGGTAGVNAAGGPSTFGGGGGGDGQSGIGYAGGPSEYGGGGGGGGSGTGTAGGAGGNSYHGGGGGGGGGNTAGGAAGTSVLGGNGGAGGTGTNVAAAGAQPGGGGGGSENANSGKGGDGRVRVTVI